MGARVCECVTYIHSGDTGCLPLLGDFLFMDLFLCAFVHWFPIRCGYLWELAISFNTPRAEARTSRHLAAQQPFVWAQSHSSCSCPYMGQLLSKLMFCTHNITTYTCEHFLFCLCIQLALTKLRVSCFTRNQRWGLSGRFKVLRIVLAWLVKPLGVWLTPVCLHVAVTPHFPGQWIIDVSENRLWMKINCSRDCTISACRLISYVVADYLKFSTLKLLCKSLSTPSNTLCWLCVSQYVLPEWSESVCFFHTNITCNSWCFLVAELYRVLHKNPNGWRILRWIS